MEVSVGDELLTARTYVPKVFTPELINKTSLEDGTYSLEVDLGEELEEDVHYAYNLVLSETGDDLQENEEPNIDVVDQTDTTVGFGNVLLRNNELNSAIPLDQENNTNSNTGFYIEADSSDGNSSSDTGPNTSTSGQERHYTLKIWAISSDYYQYLVTQKDNEFKPSSEVNFQNQYSNISRGGGGIFAGYTLKEIQVEL